MPGEKTGRVGSIDQLRGLCIVSMLFGHFAKDTIPSMVVHLPLWIDGAMGFVMISGIVIGIVRRRALDSGVPLSTVARRTVERAVQLWAVFVAIVLGSMMLRAVTGRGVLTPPVDELGGWRTLIVDVVTMQISLRYVDLLTVYVLILAVTPLFLWLLRRRNGVLLAAVVTVAIGLLDRIVPLEPIRLENVGVVDGVTEVSTVVVAAQWMALFNIGLVCGWHWRTVHRFLRRRSVGLALVTTTVVVTVVARITTLLDVEPPTWLIDKVHLAPGTFAFAVVGILALLVVLDRAEAARAARVEVTTPAARSIGWMADNLALLGRYSLSAYVIHLVIIQLTDVTVGMRPPAAVGLALVAVSLAAGLTWASLEEGRKQTATPRYRTARPVRPL